MTDRICSVTDCNRRHKAQGLCGAHYHLLRVYGDPLARQRAERGKNSCSVDGCTEPYEGRGYCRMHYARWRKHGDPHRVDLILGDDLAHFWSRVEKTETCWLWTSPPDWTGYCRAFFGGRRMLVHRWAYEHFVGPIPDGMTIDHVKARGCSRRNCVNPGHLEPVTLRENNLRSDNVGGVNARKTECIRGHAFDSLNTYVNPRTGARKCRACAALRARKSS